MTTLLVDGVVTPELRGRSRLGGMKTSLPVAERPRRREWMKVRAPSADSRYCDVKKLLHGLSEHGLRGGPLPEHLRVLGAWHRDLPDPRRDVHPGLRYCYVHSGRPEAAPTPRSHSGSRSGCRQMELKHVVVTSVDRDDVPIGAGLRGHDHGRSGATPPIRGQALDAISSCRGVLPPRPATGGSSPTSRSSVTPITVVRGANEQTGKAISILSLRGLNPLRLTQPHISSNIH